MFRRRRWTIRIAYAALALAAVTVLLCAAGQALVRHMGGTWRHAPEEARWLLSDRTQALVARAYEGLEGPVHDHRVHLFSLGQVTGQRYDNRSFVQERFLHGWQLPSRLLGAVYRHAAGVRDLDRADGEYAARLVRLARSLPGEHRLRLVALDQRYDSDGRPLPDRTPYYVDNDYVADIAGRHPELFSPVISVHPFRRDALEALERWAERGVRAVYWWPAVQHFDPADERLDPYYQALVEHDLTLLTRTGGGGRLATDAPTAYGSPWGYRRALDQGVQVVLGHIGSGTRYTDPAADGDTGGDAARVSGITLFLRLLRERGADGRLYADIGGAIQADRVPDALAGLLQHPDAFDRLVYASDYPLPSANAAIDADALAEHGFVTADQAAALAEIYDVNPLLFDFVAKRLMRLPHTDLGLPAGVFTRDAFTLP